MRITYDTPLNSILRSSEIEDIINDASSRVRNSTAPRRRNLSIEMDKEGIRDCIIEDKDLLYQAGKDVYNALGTFHTNLINLQNTIILKAKNKESEELEILLKAVDKKIRELEIDYSYSRDRYRNAVDEIERSSYKNDMHSYSVLLKSYKFKRNEALKRMKACGGKYNPVPEEFESTTSTGGITNITNLPPTPTTSTSYSLKEGDMVNIDGNEYELYRIGVDDDGNVSLFYIGEDEHVYCMGPDGELTQMDILSYDMPDTNIENQTGLALSPVYATSDEHAVEIGLPAKDDITPGDPLAYDGEVYVDYADNVTQQNQPSEQNAVNVGGFSTVDDNATNTTMKYNNDNLGERLLTYTDSNGNYVTSSYSYDETGKPVCTITDANGVATTYAYDSDGRITANGETPQNGEHFTYFCVESATDGSIVEVPVLVSNNYMSPYASSTFGQVNGDNSYITQVYIDNITGNNFGGSLNDPTNTGIIQEVSDENGVVTEYVYFSDQQHNPFGQQK